MYKFKHTHTHTDSEVEKAALPAFPNDDLGACQSLEALEAEREEDLGPLRVRRKKGEGREGMACFLGGRTSDRWGMVVCMCMCILCPPPQSQ